MPYEGLGHVDSGIFLKITLMSMFSDSSFVVETCYYNQRGDREIDMYNYTIFPEIDRQPDFLPTNSLATALRSVLSVSLL